jgi:phosphoribosylaminoimidazole (AIR) synthetase
MVIIAAKELEATIVDHLTKEGLASWTIGKVVEPTKGIKINYG